MEQENNYIIYKAQNLENGLIYIGATTKDINTRKKDHECKSNGINKNEFQEAISTYGADAFIWEQVDTTQSIDELAQKEQEYIYEYNSKTEGYNESIGGEFQKTVYKYSLKDGACIEKYNCLTDAAITVNSTKQHISRACLSVNKMYKGFYWSYLYKVPFEPENDDRKKAVVQYTLAGEEVAKFVSVAEASRQCNLSRSTIARVCRGERKKGGGYYWEYS